jgi:hypothetical protein
MQERGPWEAASEAAATNMFYDFLMLLKTTWGLQLETFRQRCPGIVTHAQPAGWASVLKVHPVSLLKEAYADSGKQNAHLAEADD